MLNERISITTINANGEKTNHDWYDAIISGMDESISTEEELVWYVLDSIAEDEELRSATRIEAEAIVMDGGAVIQRISTTVRA